MFLKGPCILPPSHLQRDSSGPECYPTLTSSNWQFLSQPRGCTASSRERGNLQRSAAIASSAFYRGLHAEEGTWCSDALWLIFFTFRCLVLKSLLDEVLLITGYWEIPAASLYRWRKGESFEEKKFFSSTYAAHPNKEWKLTGRKK